MSDPADDLNLVLEHYDLGMLQESERDRRGTVNTSFFIDTIKDGRRGRYFLRRYRTGILRDEIRFEHALIHHLSAQGGCPIARVHATRRGETVVEHHGAFYAVFDYLPGQDRYTWVRPRCTLHELRAAGRLLAQFHSDVATFRAPGHREEPRILRLFNIIAREWERACRQPAADAFMRYVHDQAEVVRRSLAETAQALRRSAGGLPMVIVHADYHPGNLKFQGEEISGLVDFDWAKVDLRAFDVALAVWYFCASWEGRADGRLRLGEVHTFLKGYQDRLCEPAAIAPLSAAELAVLPDLVNAGSLYILYWGLRDYMSKPVDPEEYLVYLRHSVQTSRWLSRPANRRRLAGVLRAVRSELPRARSDRGLRRPARPPEKGPRSSRRRGS